MRASPRTPFRNPEHLPKEDPSWTQAPSPLSAVTLLPGPFLDNMNRTLAYLRTIDPYLPGALDNTRIYARALSAGEIATLHSNGS